MKESVQVSSVGGGCTLPFLSNPSCFSVLAFFFFRSSWSLSSFRALGTWVWSAEMTRVSLVCLCVGFSLSLHRSSLPLICRPRESMHREVDTAPRSHLSAFYRQNFHPLPVFACVGSLSAALGGLCSCPTGCCVCRLPRSRIVSAPIWPIRTPPGPRGADRGAALPSSPSSFKLELDPDGADVRACRRCLTS